MSRINPLRQPGKNKYEILEGYRRPTRIISMEKGLAAQFGAKVPYVRDARAALAAGAGFPLEVKGILSIMADLSVLHPDGIPARPITYICGLLGLTSTRKWNQTLEPMLLASGRIRRVRRNSIEVFLLTDTSMIEAMPVIETPKVAAEGDNFRTVARVVPLHADEIEAKRFSLEPVVPSNIAAENQAFVDLAALHPVPPPVTPQHFGAVPESNVQIAQNVQTAKPLPIPLPSAYEVLKRAGVDVDGHPRGALFWHRVEHTALLKQWLEKSDVNAIVDRLARAKHAKKLPAEANSLATYEKWAMEGS